MNPSIERYEFYDIDLKEIGSYKVAGEPWFDEQSYLCVNKKEVLESLENEQKSIVWIVRIMREATPKAREKYQNVNGIHNEYYLLWYEGGKIQKVKIYVDDNDLDNF
ncbi:hypothetical protein ABET11_22775 [Priestia megaterium]